MIVWVNGAFGSGKTQTAYELHRRIPDSYVYDPENIGYFFRRNMPNDLCKGDFQDLLMWRDFNYAMLEHMQKEHSGIIIVPMTIVVPQYFNETIGKLRVNGILVNHFTLSASKETILKRLQSRRDGANSWPAKQIDRCLAALSNEIFAHHINTENMAIEEIAEQIASLSGISILPNTRSTLRRKADQYITQLKHIRIFH